MLITCICVSHNKPLQLPEAVSSVRCQDIHNHHWELVIIDSGVLYDQGHFDDPIYKDRRISVHKSNETEELRHTKAMAPWCFNEAYQRNLVNGKLVCYLCDDDVYYHNAFFTFCDKMWSNKDWMAMYASIDTAINLPLGEITMTGRRNAYEVGGKDAYRMDCRVDYLQFCHRKEILESFPNDEYWSESLETVKHADGVFMDKVGQYCFIHPVPIVIGQNRRCANSANMPLR